MTAAILLAHVVLIHLLLKTSALNEDISKQQSEVEQLQRENQESQKILPDEAKPAPSAPGAVRTPAPSTPSAAAVRSAQPAWRPLDYSGAFRGKIKSLPGSGAASGGILVDLGSRKVLWTKQTAGVFPIASMSKLMTLLIACEMAEARDPAFPQGFDTMIRVTREAAEVPPSKVFLAVGEKFPLRDLMIAAAVKSANDAAYLIAQHAGGGNADVFVEAMNRKAAALGMKQTHFYNPHGLPGKTRKQDNSSSAEDMIRLCEAFMSHPQLMRFTSMRIADFRTPGEKNYLKFANHNNLLPGARFGAEGVTGLKTGFTNRAGFCIAATCTRQGRTLLAIVTGYPNANGRDTFTRALLNWGFSQRQKP